ncbi:hypothetical protein BO71DRAFT_440695 [Aspergillus ellipticus CBS 707.79]|uniref:Uncharacterized protein n=1 Tax=Aspergillus ellipticus CBS 707.79 TaxID=1448320 RepID=A0A319DLH8_9EURO|nr:hypothetical protein BO71DRAFT_440695 [Aspergillus ellipticus CBS 707.79]
MQLDEPKVDTKILMVNQLWLWVIQDNTIITSTTDEVEDPEETFLQRVLDNLYQTDLDGIVQTKRSQSAIYHVAGVIMDTARGLFNAREIQITSATDSKISPLNVYSKAIQRMRDTEIKLFADFRESLKRKEKEPDNTEPRVQSGTNLGDQHPKQSVPERDEINRPGSQEIRASEHSTSEKNQYPKQEEFWGNNENPYENISHETELLEKTKNILDELNILKTLAQEQRRVNDLWEKMRSNDRIRRAVSPSEIVEDIESMMEDAKSVQSDIRMLLDLKQKEASIIEAQATRRQSDTVMTFTMVTIVFLPASFLTSLFALNISDFPHENGKVSYKGRWIFPIIFGVSFVVSAILVVLAFNANWLKHLINQIRAKKGQQRGKERTSDSTHEKQNIRQHFKTFGEWVGRKKTYKTRKPGDLEKGKGNIGQGMMNGMK